MCVFNDFINLVPCLGACLSTPNSQKKGYGRPKSAEPGSPLLRRALSPDRLHPRSAENKTSISPLANTVVKVTPRVTIAQSSSHNSSEIVSDESSDGFKEANESEKKVVSSEQKADYSKLTHGISINLGNVGMSNSTQLPRIAEEKDSPTGTKSDDYLSLKETRGAEKSEKQSNSSSSDSQSLEKVQNVNERQSKAAGGNKMSQHNRKEENLSQSTFPQQVTSGNKMSQHSKKEENLSQSTFPQQVTSGNKISQYSKKEENLSQSTVPQQVIGVVANLQKNLDQRHGQTGEKSTIASHKSFVAEQKVIGKGGTEVHHHQEGKKVLKRYKTEFGDGSGYPGAHESGTASGREKKNN